jgi:hypothetical protein
MGQLALARNYRRVNWLWPRVDRASGMFLSLFSNPLSVDVPLAVDRGKHKEARISRFQLASPRNACRQRTAPGL